MTGTDYRVVIADWSLDASGRPSGDVLALEHVHDNGLCLVGSTTLDLTVHDIAAAMTAHNATCPHLEKP